MRLTLYLLCTLIYLFPAGVFAGAMAVDPNMTADASETNTEQTLNDLQKSLQHAEKDLVENNPIRGEITRALFTHDIDGFEPVDEIITLSVKNHKVYFFTDLKNMKGEKIIHRWEFNNTVKASVEFTVTADRYRIHSSKNILPSETGEWSVVVTNKNGQVLTRHKITVVP